MSRAKTPKVYILLPVHNRKAITETFIACLKAQTYKNWHLVLIDDGSTDGTAEMVRSRVPSATVLQGRGKWWWGGSLHQGYRWLRRKDPNEYDIVLICNDDTEFGPDFLAAGVKALKPRALLLAQQFNHETGALLEVGVEWNWRTLMCRSVIEENEINCMPTRGLFLRFGAMCEIGGFRPLLMPHYLSDYEYTIRARNLGFTLMSSPDVTMNIYVELSGREAVKPGTLLEVLRNTLSLRCTSNPIYWIMFLLLSCPTPYLPANIIRVLNRYIAEVRLAVRRHSDTSPA